MFKKIKGLLALNLVMIAYRINITREHGKAALARGSVIKSNYSISISIIIIQILKIYEEPGCLIQKVRRAG